MTPLVHPRSGNWPPIQPLPKPEGVVDIGALQRAAVLKRAKAARNEWTWEEHELSEGYSCCVYDEHGMMVADHLDRETAEKIAASRCVPSLRRAELLERKK